MTSVLRGLRKLDNKRFLFKKIHIIDLMCNIITVLDGHISAQKTVKMFA